MPFRGMGKNVMKIVDETTLQKASDNFVTKLSTRLHSSAKAWTASLKTILDEDATKNQRIYSGQRYYQPLPPMPQDLQSLSPYYSYPMNSTAT